MCAYNGSANRDVIEVMFSGNHHDSTSQIHHFPFTYFVLYGLWNRAFHLSDSIATTKAKSVRKKREEHQMFMGHGWV